MSVYVAIHPFLYHRSLLILHRKLPADRAKLGNKCIVKHFTFLHYISGYKLNGIWHTRNIEIDGYFIRLLVLIHASLMELWILNELNFKECISISKDMCITLVFPRYVETYNIFPIYIENILIYTYAYITLYMLFILII